LIFVSSGPRRRRGATGERLAGATATPGDKPPLGLGARRLVSGRGNVRRRFARYNRKQDILSPLSECYFPGADPASVRYRFMTDARHARNVLIVEDDRDDAFLLKRALGVAAKEKRIALNVVHTVDGLDALGDIACKDLMNRLPDIIVVDLNMPKVDGGRFLAALRDDLQLTDLPAVVLTTATADHVLDNAMADGADAAFSKPNTQEELLAIARVILSYAPQETATPRP